MFWTIINNPSDYKHRYVAITTAINVGVPPHELRVVDAVNPLAVSSLKEMCQQASVQGFLAFEQIQNSQLNLEDVARVFTFCLALQQKMTRSEPEILVSDRVYPARENRFRLSGSFYSIGVVLYRHLQNYLTRIPGVSLQYLVVPKYHVSVSTAEIFLWNTLAYGPCALQDIHALLITQTGAQMLLPHVLKRVETYATGRLEEHVFKAPFEDAGGCFYTCSPLFAEYPLEIFNDNALEYFALTPEDR